MQKKECLLIAMLLVSNLLASANDYILDKITSANGLPQNYVRSIIQDSKGFMWFTTYDGIVRYDGYSFKVYRRHDNGLGTGLILCVTEDQKGDIWLGTENDGMYRYSVDTDYFTRISSFLPEDCGVQKKILKIKATSSNQLWVYTDAGGIYRLTINDEKSNPYQLDQFLNQHLAFPDLLVEFNGDYLTVADGKVYIYKEAENTFHPFKEKLFKDVERLFVHKNKLYLLKDGGLAYWYNDQAGAFYQLTNHPARELFISSDDQLWLSCFDGLYKTPLLGGEKKQELETVYSGNIWAISFTEDSFGNVWIGTYRDGALRFRKNYTPFKTHLYQKSIECFIEDRLGNYWTGSINGELTVFRPTQNEIVGRETFPNGMIHTFCRKDHSNQIWVGTLNGVFECQLNDKSQITCQKLPGTDASAIRTIVQDSCYLWIGSYVKGLTLYHLSCDQSRAIYTSKSEALSLPSDIIRHLLKDRNGNIWIGTAEGLVVISGATKFRKKPSLVKFEFDTQSNKTLFTDHIINLYEARNGDVWVGTLDNGLYHLKQQAATGKWAYNRISSKEGLSNNCIKSILEDDDGWVWVATNKGLNRINPKTGTIKVYQLNDGLSNNEFCDNSCLKKEDGTLAFGGASGITAFDPADFKEETTLPKVLIIDLWLNNRSVKVGEEVNGQIPLKQSMLHTRSLILSHHNHNFSIDFVGIHFIHAQQIIYKYKLEGFDKEWVTADSMNRSAKYTNIPSGHYAFMVKASSNGGQTWTEPKTMQIEVLQSLFLRWYFILLYGIACLLVLYIAIRQVRMRQVRKNDLFLAQQEKRQIQELSEMKMSFFINLSHEFRTPLTLIISPLQKLLSTPQIEKEDLLKQLHRIQYNSSILLRLINQILELSKHDKGKLNMKLAKENVVPFCKVCFSQFQSVADDKQIQLIFRSSSESIFLIFDTFRMEEILYNLISNAINHTSAGNYVKLNVTETKEKGVLIRVSDSGTGMTKEVERHLFERFCSESGIGIGLSLTKSLVELHQGTITYESEEGKGTSFQLFFPFQDEEEAMKPVETETDATTLPSAQTWIPDETNEYKAEEAEEAQTLLIVDDNRGIVLFLEELFRPYYQILKAFDGKEAFDICCEQIPSLVISDVIMPRMDGVELCAAIKSHEETSHIPVILLTAKTSKEAQQKGLSVYADAYCSKPFDNDLLISTARAILSNRNMIARKFKTNLLQGETPERVFPEKTEQEFIQKILKIIEDNISKEELTVTYICQCIGMSQLTLNKKIKQLTSQTTNSFIRSVRLKTAAQLLLSQKQTIAEVTYAVGFNDLRYFRECFKKEFGVLPSDYTK